MRLIEMSNEAWLAVISVGVFTLLFRYSFFALASEKIPDSLLRALPLVPPAALAALTLPGLLLKSPYTSHNLSLPHIFAGAIAVLISYYSENIVATILGGLLSLQLALFLGLSF